MKSTYFLFFILFLYNAYGFGVSPGSFSIQMNNGDEIEKSFFIYNDEDEPREFNVSSYGANFFNFTSFIVEVEDNNEKEINFLIRIPYETKEGDYESRIYVNELDKENGGINLDTLLGLKFNFNIKSNYSEFEEDSFKEKIEFKEISLGETFENEINEKTGFEITLFYVLLTLIIIICVYRITFKFLSKR